MTFFITCGHSRWLKTGLAVACVFSLVTFPALGVDEILMPCEVLEVSGSAKTHSDTIKKVHFMVIHHANAADRTKLSEWLKGNSGTEVKFTVAGKMYQGVLYRLAHCFGRGLLLYMDGIDVKARDIINVTFTAQSLREP